MGRRFVYKALDCSGRRFSGTVHADDEAAAAAFVRAKGLFITYLNESLSRQPAVRFWAQRQAASKALAVLCRQFAMLLRAGISLTAAINTLMEQTTNSGLRTALGDSLQQIKEGSPLSTGLNHSGIFPPLMIHMLAAGEAGGVLEEVLDRLAVHFEKEAKIKEQVKTAMLYPAVILGMAGLSVIFLLIFVLPVFTALFHELKIALPLPTRILLALSGFLQSWWALLPFLLAAVALGAISAYRQPVELLLWRLPVSGMLLNRIAVARFSRTFSTLLRVGVPILNALEVVKYAAGNKTMLESLSAAQNGIRAGMGLASALASGQVFTPLVIQMIAVGEETGELDKMLDIIADLYESEADNLISRLNSLLEPLLITVVGVVTGALVLAAVLPMFDVVAAIGSP